MWPISTLVAATVFFNDYSDCTFFFKKPNNKHKIVKAIVLKIVFSAPLLQYCFYDIFRDVINFDSPMRTWIVGYANQRR